MSPIRFGPQVPVAQTVQASQIAAGGRLAESGAVAADDNPHRRFPRGDLSSGSPPLPTSLAPPLLASPSAASSPIPPSSAATAPSTGRSSLASSIRDQEDSNQPRRPTPTLLPPALSPAAPASPSTTSHAAEGATGILATSATVASSSTAALMCRKASSSGTSRCATLSSGDTCFCLKYPTSYSPPSRFRNNMSNFLRLSLCRLELNRRWRRHHSESSAGCVAFQRWRYLSSLQALAIGMLEYLKAGVL
ncbi:unnamed protein product [Urochloa humidicola]